MSNDRAAETALVVNNLRRLMPAARSLLIHASYLSQVTNPVAFAT